MKTKDVKKAVFKVELPSWDLSKAYYASIDDPQIDDDIDKIKANIKMLARYEGKIHTLAPYEFEMFIALYESVITLLHKLFRFAHLNADTQKTNQKATAFASRLEAKLDEELDKIFFVNYELASLTYEQQTYFLGDPKLRKYVPWMERVFSGEYEYPDLEELLDYIQLTKSATDENWGRLYSETCSAMEFKLSGKTYNLSQIRDIWITGDQKHSAAADKELQRVYKQHAATFTQIFNSILKNEDVDAKLNGCYDAEEMSSYYNAVPRRQLLEMVTTVCDSFYPISRRYYALMAKLHESPKCRPAAHIDLNPIIIPEKKYTWEECKKIVLDAYTEFSEDYAATAKSIIDANVIDVAPKDGKKSGAYCCGGPLPYIFLNFMGKRDDLNTFAHELGHAVNDVLAAQWGILNDKTPISLAEVASEFAEYILFAKQTIDLAEKEGDVSDEVLYLLIERVGDMVRSIHRQIALYNFEKRAHRERQKGELSTERLAQIWSEEFERYTGIKLEGDKRNEWMYVPHLFETPFYVYCYAFAGIIVNNLVKVFEDDDLDKDEIFDFQRRFIQMLSNTGIERYSELLEPFEIDVDDPEFWQNGIACMTELLDNIEEIAKAKGLLPK